MLVESSARHGSGERWQRGPHAIRSLLPAFACLKHTHTTLRHSHSHRARQLDRDEGGCDDDVCPLLRPFGLMIVFSLLSLSFVIRTAGRVGLAD